MKIIKKNQKAGKIINVTRNKLFMCDMIFAVQYEFLKHVYNINRIMHAPSMNAFL